MDEKKGTCTVTFTKDKTPRKILGEPIFLDKKEDDSGIDLALLALEDYPTIQPAKRSYNCFILGQETFAHTAGYGYFYYKFDEYPIGIGVKNWNFIHAIAGSYEMGDNTSGEHKILFEKLKQNENLNFLKHVGSKYFLSLHSERCTIQHPITSVDFPCAPLLPGFSGGPLFSPTNEIIAINAKRSWGSCDELYRPFSLYYPRLSHLLSFYNLVSHWTNGYVFGENSHYTTNLIGGAFAIFFSYGLYNTLLEKFSYRSLMGPAFMLSLWKFTNLIGDVLSRFSNGFQPFGVVEAGHNYSLAIPIEPWNKRIDDYLMNGSSDEDKVNRS